MQKYESAYPKFVQKLGEGLEDALIFSVISSLSWRKFTENFGLDNNKSSETSIFLNF